MTDNLNDFFSDNAQWVDDTSAGSSFDAALPPQPPKSRRDMRKRREQQRRRRYVTIIAAAVVVILVVVGGFFGVRCFGIFMPKSRDIYFFQWVKKLYNSRYSFSVSSKARTV